VKSGLNPLAWLRVRRAPAARAADERQQARELIAAVDAGGLPLMPRRVNDIARGLGLEVSAHAPVEQTIARIRAALQRIAP
jgi:hypothetical protein